MQHERSVRVSVPTVELAEAAFRRFFGRVNHESPRKAALDALDERKVHEQVGLLCRTFGVAPEALAGRRLLEVGSGFGVFVAVARVAYGIEAHGVEPAGPGYNGTPPVTRSVLAEYGLPADAIVDASGERLPFPSGYFDLVFSSTVLEHTANPEQALDEAVRVLKPGGMMQFVFPNYGGFYEGHYVIPWIPYLPKGCGGLWVRLWGRDPEFLDTLQLVNLPRIRRWLRGRSDFRIVTLGQEIFRDRMLANDLKDWGGLGRVQKWLNLVHRLRLVRPVTWMLERVGSFDPIVLSLVRIR